MYYPKSQIKTNLYTNGGEFITFDTDQEYIGSYWKTSSGEYYTGVSPDSRGYRELVPMQKEQVKKENTLTVNVGGDADIYNSLKGVDLNSSSKNIPSYYYPQPTEENYKLGSFIRYFAKRSNQNIYIEINKSQYESLTKKQDNWDFASYRAFKIEWTLSGSSPQQVSNINQSIVAVTERKLKITGLLQYFKDYSKFYKA